MMKSQMQSMVSPRDKELEKNFTFDDQGKAMNVNTIKAEKLPMLMGKQPQVKEKETQVVHGKQGKKVKKGIPKPANYKALFEDPNNFRQLREEKSSIGGDNETNTMSDKEV